MARTRDVVVVGAGIGGVATALELQRRGVQVTLVDAWEPGHARAASAGEHRILRSSHGRDELYTRWSREARMGWMELQEEAGIPLFEQAGALLLAHEANTVWEDHSRDALTAQGIPHVVVPPDELKVRVPIMDPQGIAYGLWETESGFVYAKAGLLAMLARFQDLGGQVQRGAVTTDRNERPHMDGAPLRADVVVMACGAWMRDLFRRTLGRLLEIMRQDLILVAPPAGDPRYDHTHFPAWIDHHYPAYGIPAADGHGFKAAINWRSIPLDLDKDDRIVDPTSLVRSRLYLAHRFPGLADRPVTAMAVCQIINTPDTHFIIDHHPDHDDVLFVAGGSGHLYKHGPMLGRFAADVAMGRTTTDPRFAVSQRGGGVALADRPQ